MSADIALISRAADFAARAHGDQKRKGAKEEPYLNHLAEVACLLAEAGADAQLVAAGWLHDTVEDCGVTLAALEAAFGRDVASLVKEVTDDKALTKPERKRRQIEEAPGKSDRARCLKIADKTSNLRALMVTPPNDWSMSRIEEYLAWASNVVACCRGISPSLEQAFDAAAATLQATCGVNRPRDHTGT